MRRVKRISEDEMVCAFLLSEYYSKRFSKRIKKGLKELKISKNIILSPNDRSSSERQKRARLLGLARGYQKNSLLFEGYPKDVTWWQCSATKRDLENFWFINHEIWTELSAGTRRLKNVRKTYIDRNKSETAETIRAIKDAFQKANEIRPIIVLSPSLYSPKRMILEGHARATALSQVGDACFPIEVIWGISPAISKMRYW